MTGFLAEQLGTAHWFDQRETREALQWEPAVSLDEGFRRLRAWFEEQTSRAPDQAPLADGWSTPPDDAGTTGRRPAR